jgi:hypothetical protein
MRELNRLRPTPGRGFLRALSPANLRSASVESSDGICRKTPPLALASSFLRRRHD